MEDASSADFEPYPCADPTSVCLLRLHECRDTISHLNESACLKIADACLKKSKTDVMALGLVCNPLQPTARCANPDFTCEHIWSIGCGFGHNPACSGTLASLSADSCLFLGYTNHVSDIVRAGIVCNR